MPSSNVDPLYIRRPLPWLSTALACGILLAGLSDAHGLYPVFVLLLITISAVVVATITKRTIWFFLTLLSLALALGFLRFRSEDAIGPNDVSWLAPATVQLSGVVNDVKEIYFGSGATMRRAWFTIRAGSAVSAGIDFASVPVSGYVDVSVPIPTDDQNDDSRQPHGVHAGEPPRYGDEVWLAGRLELPVGPRNPGAFDERKTMARRGVSSRLTVVLPANWRILHAAGTNAGVLRPIFGLKNLILSHGRHVLSRERAGVLNAILLGAKSELSPADRAMFEKTGTVHVLATAGLHTGLVVAMLLYLLPFAGLPRRPVILLTLGCLAVFTIMAGDRPAVVRAAVMGVVYLVGMLLEREPDLTNTIALAGLGLLLSNPFNLFDFGFQISFATVITLALGMKLTLPLRRGITARMSRQTIAAGFLRGASLYLTTCVCVTVMAQIGSMPLIVYYLNILTPAGLIANLLIVPVVAPVIALGFAAAMLGTITPAPILSLPLDWMLNIVTGYILSVVRLCSGPQFGLTSMRSPSIWLVIFYYAALWGWLGWLRAKVRNRERVEARTQDPLPM